MNNPIAHAERAHSAVGGSTAKRVLNCTGSVELAAKYPNVTSSFAAHGTAMHEAIDLIVQGRVRKDEEVIGLTLNDTVVTDDDFDDCIAPALEVFDMLDRELGGIEFFNEVMVQFPGIDNAFGTVDIVGFAKDRSIILDWKFGSGVAVSADRNEQLMYYAYAAAHTEPYASRFDRNKPIELFIVQPRSKDGEPFTRWLTTFPQLEAFALELRKAVAVSKTPLAEYKLGDWCRFCPARTGCPLYTGKVQEISTLSRPQLEQELSKWLPYADMMASWADDLKALAHNHLTQGGSLPGWKLVNKKSIRKWVDENAAVKWMTRMKLPADQRYTKKLLSPAKTEQALKPMGVSAIPDELIDKTSSGTTLAPDKDPRPAIIANQTALAEVFAAALSQAKP